MTATQQQQQPNLRHYDDELLDAHIADLVRQISEKNAELDDATTRRAIRLTVTVSPHQLRQQLKQLCIDLSLAQEERQRRTI